MSHVSIPSNVDSVISGDGRVFYSLDALIDQYGPIVERQQFGANITGDPEDIAFAAGQAMILNAIVQSRDTHSLDDTFDRS